MQVNDTLVNNKVARYINLAVLAVVVGLVLFYPFKKQIWYDESVSILCSKGLYYTNGNALTALSTNTSSSLAAQNTAAQAYNCTIIDNGNSFLYNELLHYYTDVFGNAIESYTWLSKLCALGVLLSVFMLCSLLWGNSLFTSLVIILLGTDGVYWGMAHEIRAYEMGMMFIILAASFCYSYLYKKSTPISLLLTGLFCVAAILSHYLSAYAVLVMLAYIIFTKKQALLKPANILAMLVPVLLVGVYFVLAAKGFATMQHQNAALVAKKGEANFQWSTVLLEAMKFTAYNFKFMMPAFLKSTLTITAAFVCIVGLYIAAIRLAASKVERRNLHLLFLLGISGTLFLGALCIKSHHYTALYFRYFSFCLPFATLFTVYALFVIKGNKAVHKLIVVAVGAIVTLPALLFFARNINSRDALKFNHMQVAQKVTASGAETLVVPDWTDAFLVQSFLPEGCQVKYVLDTSSKDFTLVRNGVAQKVPVIRINL